MSGPTKVSDPAFQGVGQKVGTDIWRIENFQPVPLPKTEYGKFYMGDSYIILQTTQNKSGSFLFDIHFWIGRDTSQDESGTAAIKSVELDAALGGRAVQHRELQGHESDKFLSYFKPCIIPLEGGVASGFRKYEEEEFETRLYTCKGRRVVKMKQVPFARSSLNHDDVFILDTEDKIYQFNGANSNIQERAKALEVVQYLKEKYHQGVCDVAIVDDGKLDTESDSGEFWVLFGGFAPIGKKASTDDDVVAEATPPKLYSIADGKTSIIQGELSRSLLENNKCYLLDCGSAVYVWVGRLTQVDERKMANQVAEEFITNQKRPRSVQITRLIQGYETHSFKSNFGSWPAGSAAAGAEEGRGKVAALLKQQGVGIKGMSKSTQANEDVPPLLEGGGKMEVWYVNEDTKTPVSSEDVGKFYSGDCYIILYAYHSGERKEDYLLYTWYGKDSVEEDQTTAARLASSMSNALKGKPVQGRVFQGKEPPQFVALFQPLVFFKGGVSAGYKKWIAEKGLADETYSADNISLIEISGTSVHNNKAVQVDHVATSLDSGHSFVLQTTSSLFIWHGSQCPFELQQSAVKVAEFLKPGVTLKHAKEGTESSIFWSALGGKQNYTSKKAAQDIVRDPHLYTISSNKGRFQVQEVFNFSQDDLLTEDVLILDTHAEVFVWIGQLVDSKEKQNAFEIGQSYIELAASLEGLPPKVPLYKVTEGTEPMFFTTYFSWDNTKAITQGNSFQKKVSLLFGIGNAAEDKTNASGGPRQRSEALAALNSAFNSSSEPKPVATRSSGRSQGGGSQRAAAVAALSNVLTAEKKQGSDSPPASQNRSPHPDEGKGEDDNFQAEKEDGKDDEDKDGGTFSPSFENDGGQEDNVEPVVGTYTYDQLKAKSENPVTGIDFKRREEYLSPEEFETIFGVTKEAFSKLPKWKQNMQKKKFDLF